MIDIDPHPLPHSSASAIDQPHIVQHDDRRIFFDIGFLRTRRRWCLRSADAGKGEKSCHQLASELHRAAPVSSSLESQTNFEASITGGQAGIILDERNR